MKIKKGTSLKISHTRKGQFYGIAYEDFDTTKEEFYPIKVAQIKAIQGANTEWNVLDKIPCRGKFCKIEKIESTQKLVEVK